MNPIIHVEPGRVIGRRDQRIYGQFIEHFHRQIYGGIFDPESQLSDDDGLRTDVLLAIARINPGIVRWPGGCFASAYHWTDGVGAGRQPHFDKAWLVEESNRFGTDEFIRFCRKIDAKPYICTNGGTGTPEEMSDWVEYCNLAAEGRWARLRSENGHPDPHSVKIWSIGNESYGDWEIGAKSAAEWAGFVKESAKMMKAVDPTIELSAASFADVEWNLKLLREAGDLLDWISIHHYWDPLWEANDLAPYEICMTHSLDIHRQIEKIEHVLGALGYLGKIRIAFDEWNLRGWHHPRANPEIQDKLGARDQNDLNQSYTMADAVFAACFLNEALRHCNTVRMANFAPVVNSRGLIYAHPEGIVLRPTYHVFDLYANHMGETVIDSWIEDDSVFDVSRNSETIAVPSLDSVATTTPSGDIQLSVVNRHPEKPITVGLSMSGMQDYSAGEHYKIAPDSKDSYNDIESRETVKIGSQKLQMGTTSKCSVEIAPHSISVVTLRAR